MASDLVKVNGTAKVSQADKDKKKAQYDAGMNKYKAGATNKKPIEYPANNPSWRNKGDNLVNTNGNTAHGREDRTDVSIAINQNKKMDKYKQDSTIQARNIKTEARNAKIEQRGNPQSQMFEDLAKKRSK